MRKCDVANHECEGATSCVCFACGNPVCKRDSIRLPYGAYGIRRICVICIEERDRRLGPKVVEDWYIWQHTRRTDDELRNYRPMLLSVPKPFTLKL
jgi:hypothetical protein